MSSSMWSPSTAGADTDIGRVENREVALLVSLLSKVRNYSSSYLVGATYGDPLVNAMPSMLCCKACAE